MKILTVIICLPLWIHANPGLSESWSQPIEKSRIELKYDDSGEYFFFDLKNQFEEDMFEDRSEHRFKDRFENRLEKSLTPQQVVSLFGKKDDDVIFRQETFCSRTAATTADNLCRTKYIPLF